MAKPTWPRAIRPINESGFRIRIKYESKTYQKTIPGNHASKADLKAAIAERDRMMESLMLGINPLITNDENAVPRRTLFIEDAQEYLNSLNVEYSTESDYTTRLNTYWLPLFHNRYTEDIHSREIQRYLNSLSVSEKTKRNILIPLKGVFDFADIQPNPANRIKLQKHQEKRIERFTPAQRNLILEELSGQTFLYFAIAFGTGIRPSGEMLALRWEDYDGERIYVHQSIVRRVLKPTTKTKVARHVIITNWLKPMMDRHRQESGWIFPNEHGSFHKDADNFNAAWRNVFDKETIKSQGLTYQKPYTCRHTRAAELLSAGVFPATAANQLGHSVEMFLNRYSEYIEAYARSSEVDLIKGEKTETD